MRYWLLKSEPSVWSWDDQCAAGQAGTVWDGVRNHLAKRHLMAMQRGDRAFFYHSNEGKAIVGIVEVTEEHRPDPSDASGTFVMVGVRAVATLARPVTLAHIRTLASLRDMALLTSARLSVQPVTSPQWETLVALGGVTPLAGTIG